ncbi:nuclear transport factor 2 family protein [Streptomyces sp. NPDC049906]|uniref:nuclear transport factor 2 family protein n=1 Tax=Streptomyces sp. NPDC049906 TaxID=3155656 RepID=UPI003443B8F8
MTQRVDLATVMDRLAVDSLLTEYARALDAGDWAVFRRLFVPGGHVDHPCAEDPAEHPATGTDAVDRLAAALAPIPPDNTSWSTGCSPSTCWSTTRATPRG